MQAIVFNPRLVNWLACKGLGWFWPGIYHSRLSALQLTDVPIPPLPGPDWVRLRTVLGGICGTDLAMIWLRHHPASMLRAFMRLPIILGHENVAVVEAIGPDAQAAGWQPGQRVCVEPMLSCQVRGVQPPCRPCAEGRFSLCENLAGPPMPPGMMIGVNSFTGGTWAQFFVAHHSQLHRVPDEIPDQLAVLTDPLACSLHAVLRRRPDHNETVLVLGAGMLGLGVIAAIRALHCRANVTCIARYEHQRHLALQLGAEHVLLWRSDQSTAQRYRALADHTGARCLPAPFGNQAVVGGFDLVYDCIGTGRSLTDAAKWARAGATVLEVGTPAISLVETTPIWLNELTVMGCYGRQIENYNGRRMHTYQIIFDLITSQRLQPRQMLTHTFAITDYRRALATIADRRGSGLIKAAFTPANS